MGKHELSIPRLMRSLKLWKKDSNFLHHPLMSFWHILRHSQSMLHQASHLCFCSLNKGVVLSCRLIFIQMLISILWDFCFIQLPFSSKQLHFSYTDKLVIYLGRKYKFSPCQSISSVENSLLPFNLKLYCIRIVQRFLNSKIFVTDFFIILNENRFFSRTTLSYHTISLKPTLVPHYVYPYQTIYEWVCKYHTMVHVLWEALSGGGLL